MVLPTKSKRAPKGLKPGQKVKVKGQVREEVMTFAGGPVLEVKSFEISSD